ncbi:MAG: CdaR family protein [Gemmatimonadota bacterium]
MSLQSLFIEKWPYKVTAIVLFVLLWLNVTADQPTQDEAIATRIEFDVRDSAWAIGEAPTEVMTIFQGRSGDIIALFNAPVIRPVIENVEDSVVEVVLDVDDVEYDRSLNVLATGVSPPRVFVHLEPRRVVTLPVMPITGARPAPGFAIARVIVSPDSARLSGPASAVDPLFGIDTKRLEMGELTEGVTRLVDLQRPPGPSSLTVSPSQVSVTVEIDSLIVRRFQVTVGVVGSAASAVAVDPLVVVVEVSGAARIVATLLPTDLEVSVRLDHAPAGPEQADVSIRLPAGMNATAVAVPSRVTVTPRSTRASQEGPSK